jgi:S-layer protein
MAVSASDLQKLYVAYFGRPADPSGIAFYTSSSMDIWQIAAAFSASPESQALYGAVSGNAVPADVINNIYLNLFNRPAEPAGIFYWQQWVNAAPGRSVGGIAEAILLGAQNQDLVTINNKLAVATTFTAHIDTTAELLAYQGNAAAAVARTFLATVTSDSATVTTATANVDTTILVIQGVGGLPGQNAVLTTGVDNYVGTSANDTITGVVGGTAAQTTLTGLDTINGGAGNDTLVIDDLAGATALPGGIAVTNIEKIVVNSVGDIKMDLSSTSATSISTGTVSGAVDLTASKTQGVTVVDATAGKMVTVTGGASQTVTTAGGVTLSKAAGAISVTDTTGTGVSVIDGGTNVGVSITNSTKAGVGSLTIGGTTAPTGTITVSEAVTGDKAANTAAGAIKITGGTVVSVSETATEAVNTAAAAGATNTNFTLTESAITVTGTTDTTQVYVAQTATVAVKNTTTAAAAKAETDVVTFSAVAKGAVVTVGGLSFTAGAALTADEVAAAFANLSAGAVAGTSTKGTYQGTFSAGSDSTGAVDTTKHTVTVSGNTLVTATGAAVVQSQAFSKAVAAVAGNGGVTAGTVTIADKLGAATGATITTVSVDGYGAGSTIASGALATLTLADSNADMSVSNAASKTLDLTLNKVGTSKAVAVLNLDAGGATYTTLNVHEAGASNMTLTATKVATLNVDGSATLTLNKASALTGVAAINVTGSAGLSINAGTSATAATLKDVNASGTSGSMTVLGLDATVATYEGSTGSDRVSVAGNVAKAISLGAGNDTFILGAGTIAAGGSVDGGTGTDTLSVDATAAATASTTPTFATKVFGFENLDLTGVLAAAQTVDVTALGNFASVTDDTTTTGVLTLTIDKLASGGTLVIGDGITAHDIVNITNAKTGTADVLNIVGDSSSGAGQDFGGVTASNVETVNVTLTDSSGADDGSLDMFLTVGDTSATSIKLMGNQITHLTADSTKLTSVDASGMTGGLVYTTTGTTAEMVKGGASSNDLTAKAGTSADTLVGGAGDDVLTANAGRDVLTGNGGNDTFVVATPTANLTGYSTITDANAGDLLQLADNGTETFNTKAISLDPSTAVFQDYADASVAAGNGNISWFQFGGNTYVVEAMHAGTNFQNNVDVVVKLVGLVDLSHASLNNAAAPILQINA